MTGSPVCLRKIDIAEHRESCRERWDRAVRLAGQNVPGLMMMPEAQGVQAKRGRNQKWLQHLPFVCLDLDALGCWKPDYIYTHICTPRGLPGSSVTREETPIQSLGLEEPLKKEMATHSSILSWEIPWTEETGRLQSMGSQKNWT